MESRLVRIPSLRRRAVLTGLLAALVSSGVATGCQPRARPARCAPKVVVLGDSRVVEQSTVIPRTTDAIVGRILGNEGSVGADGQRDHVDVLAAPGTVHRDHAEALRAFTDTCRRTERPLIIDVLGTNYLYEYIERQDDPTLWDEIAAEIDAFYDESAPNGRVVLEELFLDMRLLDGANLVGAQAFLDGYNGKVLQALAERDGRRYLHVPKPAEVDAGQFAFRDASHPASSSLLAFYGDALEVVDVEGAAAFDAAALAAIDGAGSACAVLDLPGFSRAENSQTRILMAQLADLSPNRNSRMAAWLSEGFGRRQLLDFSITTEDCRDHLRAP